jgi:hypothetical protein
MATVTKKKINQEDVPPPISTISSDSVLAGVFAILGKPNDLLGGTFTRATPLSQFTFRVNIYRKVKLTDAERRERLEDYNVKLANSFYVKVDGTGEVLYSNPPITRRYE